MPKDEELQWIEMTDFSPGIWSNNNLAGGLNVTSDNPCKAQPLNTYRCRALPTGGLGPLPRLKASYGLTTIPAATAGTVFKVVGFNTWGRIIDVPNTSSLGFEAHVMLYRQQPNGVNFDASLTWLRERLFNVTPSTETIHNTTLVATGTSAGRYTYFLKTRMNPALPDTLGSPVMVCVSSRIASNDIRVARAWPDPAAPTTNATVVIGSAADAYVIAAAHQGRIVLGKWYNYAHGLTADLITNENLLWTDTNDNSLVSAIPAQFVPELDQSISDMCPMSANQLVVIKFYGGGYVLQGDLSDTTVVQLPNLPCPDGSDYVRGVNTAKGFVYSGGPSGMYLWNGGDGAECISTQLDGNFAVGSGFVSGANGQCDRWMDLVLVPQNWVWDAGAATPAWWRIEDDTVVNIRYWSTVAQNSQAIGATSSFTTASPLFMHYFKYNELAHSWSWQSHPLWLAPPTNRMEVRQLLMAVQGFGTFTITFTDEFGGTATSTVTVASNTIVNVRANVSLDAQNLMVRIQASGSVADVPAEAPKLHRMYVGYRSAQHLALSA